MSATAQAGCLIVLDSMSKPVETFSGSPIDGPWDMTALDQGTRASLFVTNVLNGGVATANSPHVVNKGTVVRIEISVPKAGEGMPMIHSTQIIGSGFAEISDSNALIIGPTGRGTGQGRHPLRCGFGEQSNRGDSQRSASHDDCVRGQGRERERQT
jgi:hypothetical protein